MGCLPGDLTPENDMAFHIRDGSRRMCNEQLADMRGALESDWKLMEQRANARAEEMELKLAETDDFRKRAGQHSEEEILKKM